MQSSITAWLKKPSSVEQAPAPEFCSILPLASTIPDSSDYLPTPPPEETCDARQPGQDLELEQPEEENQDTIISTPEQTSPAPFRSSTHQPLIPNITLEPCTKTNVQSFKRLNALLLPIPYPPKFYSEILSDPTTASLTLLAIWHDTPPLAKTTSVSTAAATLNGRVVGGIRCRLLPSPTSIPSNNDTSDERPILYISTLVVLSPYRTHGIATHLLSAVLAYALRTYNVRSVGAHVWVNNTEGRAWYAKQGFKEVRVEEGYYRRLEPTGAVVVERAVKVGDLLGRG